MNTLQTLQHAFARRVRDPQRLPLPAGVEPRRMRIYEELVYNTIEGFVSGGFPVLQALLEEATWQAMVRTFVATHRCHTPYFLRIGEEFVGFLSAAPAGLALPPFAQELAHYEWVELALDVAEDVPEPRGTDPDADLLRGVPVLNPQLFVLAYRWPVHRIGRAYRPAEPPAQPTFLVAYRNAALEVKFLESNALTHRLLELLAAGTLIGQAVLEHLCTELGQPGDPQLLAAGRETLQRLRGLGIVLGARPERATDGA